MTAGLPGEMCRGAGRESQLTAGIGDLYYVVIQGASVYHARRRLRITVDLPNSKDKERGEKMRHRPGGGGGQSATRGCISSPSRVKNPVGGGSPLSGRVVVIQRGRRRRCAPKEQMAQERGAEGRTPETMCLPVRDQNVTVTPGRPAGCLGPRSWICALLCANPSASVAQGQGGRDRGQADDI